MDSNYRITLLLVAGFALALAGCASTGSAPVEDHSIGGVPRSRPAPTPPAKTSAATAGSYRVQRGDTLYSIAFRHGVDYRDLAAWNGIAPPYTIFVGRELNLSNPSKRAAVAVAPVRTPSPPSPPASTQPSGTRQGTPSTSVVATPNTANPPPPLAAAATKPPQATPVAPTANPGSAPEPAAAGDIAWRWPADGAVTGGYVAGDPMKQGIDIAGQAGSPVRAAADGVVVYSGNGLIGYGELIIVKHNPAFLSAYGHNRKRLVQEGDHVKGGQTIAEMGSSAANRNELHFEIRRNGKPTNPLDYLPHR